jgi:hypothetical protein
VPTSTRQLAELTRAQRATVFEADVSALLSGAPEAEIARLGAESRRALEQTRLAIVATPRERRELTLEEGELLVTNLARVIGELDPLPDAIVAKGGITADVTIRVGLGADAAEVVGPIADGVALWRVGRDLDYVVFPGNVGGDGLLATLVTEMLSA